ncbi:MAG: SDR family oxidoreductase [Pseudomonadota bacterium]|nr:SDR family oxidoreductase [Pseudomonadota bacterium]
MTEPLQGRVALVTGGAQRTGRDIALALAEAGADLVVHYRQSAAAADSLRRAVRDLGRRCWCFAADFSDPAAVTALAARVTEEVGVLDVLVNNVGVYPVARTLAQTPEDFAATFQTNLFAPYALIRGCMPLLINSEAGQVINIGYAGTELLTANTHAATYQLTKTALLLLTKNIALEYGPAGVRANMLSPGQLDNSVDLPDRAEQAIPLGRPGTPADIAAAILFLLTTGSYITGVNLDVAGGYKLALARHLEPPDAV